MYIKSGNYHVLFESTEKPALGAGLSLLHFRPQQESPWPLFWDGLPPLCREAEEPQTTQESERPLLESDWEVNRSQQRLSLLFLWHKSIWSGEKKPQVHPWEIRMVRKLNRAFNWYHSFPSWGLLDAVCAWFDDVISVYCYFFFYLEASPEGTLFSTRDSQSRTPSGFLRRAFQNDFCRMQAPTLMMFCSIYLLLGI